MTDELATAFARDGFLRLEALAAEDEIERLHDVFERLFAPDTRIDGEDRVEPASGGALAQVLNPERCVPELLATEAYRSARATRPGSWTARDYGASISTCPSRTCTSYARTRVPSGSTHDLPSSSRNSQPCQGQRMTSVASAT